MKRKLVSFDWAMKRILREKANFEILEGFLSELLKFDVKIQEILESEANQDSEIDKFNRVDMLAKNIIPQANKTKFLKSLFSNSQN